MQSYLSVAGFAVLFAPLCVGLVFSLFFLVLPKRLALVAHVWLEVARLVSRHDLIYSKDKKTRQKMPKQPDH